MKDSLFTTQDNTNQDSQWSTPNNGFVSSPSVYSYSSPSDDSFLEAPLELLHRLAQKARFCHVGLSWLWPARRIVFMLGHAMCGDIWSCVWIILGELPRGSALVLKFSNFLNTYSEVVQLVVVHISSVRICCGGGIKLPLQMQTSEPHLEMTEALRKLRSVKTLDVRHNQV